MLNTNNSQKTPFKDLSIKLLEKKELPFIVQQFAFHNWPKSLSTFEIYFQEQTRNQRLIWVAFYKHEIAGYITLKWVSSYEPFRKNNIPEIKDFNVLPVYRNKGIGSALLETAEKEAARENPQVGLGVGLYEGYGNAQRLYIAKGYIPHGQGITYNYQKINFGDTVILDDFLVLWLTKKLW